MGTTPLAEALGAMEVVAGRALAAMGPTAVQTALETAALLLAAGCGALALLIVASTAQQGPEPHQRGAQGARRAAAAGPLRPAGAALAAPPRPVVVEVGARPAAPGLRTPRWSAAPRTAVATSASLQRAARAGAGLGPVPARLLAPLAPARPLPARVPALVLAGAAHRCAACTGPRCRPSRGLRAGAAPAGRGGSLPVRSLGRLVEVGPSRCRSPCAPPPPSAPARSASTTPPRTTARRTTAPRTTAPSTTAPSTGPACSEQRTSTSQGAS